MGRMLGKCKGGGGEIAVVGVRTRARAALAMAEATSSVSSSPAKKIRKVSATTTKYDVHELKRRRRAAVAAENSASCRSEEDDLVIVQTAANCSTTGELCSDFPASCYSSNDASGSCEVVKNRLEIITDPEQADSAETSPRCFDYHRTARREKKPGVAKSDDQDSPPRRPDAKSTVQIKMPSDSEIEDFFTAAEKDLQKRFTDKYNFDIVKDVPLEGRYEWVRIKP